MIRGICSLSEFAPFGVFHIDFPPVEDKPSDLGEVHLLTGVNGTGKTRLLSLMAATLGNPKPLQKRLKGVSSEVRIGFTNEFQKKNMEHTWSRAQASAHNWNIHRHDDFHATTASLPAFAYHGSAYLSDANISVMAALSKPSREHCLSFERPADHSQQLLQAITNLKLQAAMDSMNEGAAGAVRARSTRLIKALESALSQITNSNFHFLVTTYPNVSLGVRWNGAELSFDLLPDGLRSIIGWLVHAVVMMDVWLQGKSDPMDTEAIFLLDEIESHLHPAWQRKILPAFQHLFPKAQIFVATHSPFVIASLNHGWIHRLTLASPGKVTVEKPLPASKGDSYVSVVEDIMGLKEWYDPETEELLARFRKARAEACQGDRSAQDLARKLATDIGQRSMELDYMMGRELHQLERQLAKFPATK